MFYFSDENVFMVGDEGGKVWVFKGGQVSAVQKIFSSPVKSIQCSSDVVMISTYSSIVILSKEHLIGEMIQPSLVELKVYLYLYMTEIN